MPLPGTATHALIVEPDAARAAQYKPPARTPGLAPTVVESGEEALFALSHLGPLALIVIEAALPDGDGLSFLQEIRGSQREEAAPAILIVGTRNAHDKAAGAMIRLGVAALLPPSHTMGSLEKAVDRAVNRKPGPDASAFASEELLPETNRPPPPSSARIRWCGSCSCPACASTPRRSCTPSPPPPPGPSAPRWG